MLGSFRSPRAVVKLAIDVGLFLIATPLAFALRYDGNLGSEHPLLLAMVVLVPVKAGLDYLLGLPNRSWRGLTFRDLSSLMLHAGGVLAFGLILIALLAAVRSRSLARVTRRGHNLHANGRGTRLRTLPE